MCTKGDPMTFCRAAAVGALVVLSAGASWSGVPGQKARAFDEVVADLQSPDAGTRLDAVRQLSAAGYPEATRPLVALLNDPDERVAREAMYAELGLHLGARMQGERRVAFVVEMPRSNPASRAFEDSWGSLPVMPVPGEIIEALSRRLTGENLLLRLETIAALGVLGQVEGAITPVHEAAAEALAQRLGDPKPPIRAAAARAAGRMFRRCVAPCEAPGVERLGDALVRGLNDPEAPVLMAVIEGLGDMRWARAAEALTRVYDYFKKQPPALAALDALARIGSPGSVTLFKAAAARREPAARRAAVEGLARAGDRDALAAAVTEAQAVRADVEVVLGAAFALQRAGLGQHLSPLLNAAGGDDTALQVQDYLVELGPAVAPQVAAALPAAKGEARARLIEVLAVTGGPDQVAAIEAARGEGGPRVTGAADRALKRLAASR
jgi:HEAT repeat protein